MDDGRACATWLVLLGCTASLGCGRIGFEARATGDAAGMPDDAPGTDASPTMLVQRASDSLASGTTLSVTMPAAPAIGHELVMVGGSNIASLASITGGSANWTRAAGSTAYPNIEIWFGVADGTATVTITAIGTTGLTLALSEWSGLATVAPLDMATAASGTTSPASAGTITTTHAPDLVIFGAADYLVNTFGTPTGGTWTMLDTTMSSSMQSVWYEVATSPGAYQGQVSETVHMWDAAIAAFRIAP